MRVRYLIDRARVPQPALGGGVLRPRPVMAVCVAAAGGSWILDGHLDTASDDTVFPNWVAGLLGLDLTQVPEYDITLAGRPQPVRGRYLPITLRITDGVQEAYEWQAVVGFVAVSLRRALLGHAGFLQFFDVQFLGADHEVVLLPNRDFSGQRV